MPPKLCLLTLLTTIIIINTSNVLSEVLTPPYFNIAENREVEASYTCGVGVEEPELYCKLVGAVQDYQDKDNTLIGGQVCDVCDPNRPGKDHPPTAAVDGAETYWISPPLSRGPGYNEVNFTINLGQEFHVAYVIIKMGISPRPGLWVLEKSADNGLTYQPWQYFAESASDCEHYFGSSSLEPIDRDDSVMCTTQFSKIVPLEHGEIVVSLLRDRPSANDFFNSSLLQEFTRATNVRLRLLRTQTLYGHLMSLERQDPTVTRRYFYSIKDISIGGRCRCNGHADVCIEKPDNPYKLKCECQHNTCGDNCDRCCDNKVQKKWRQSKANHLFICEACNCNGHSEHCFYNETVDFLKHSMDLQGQMEGGGQCKDCRDNTEGINCEKCKPGFYLPWNRLINQTNACVPCNCDGKRYTGNCEKGSGRCECKPNYQGRDCDSCSFGFTKYDDCIPCKCNQLGSINSVCEPVTGDDCPCKPNYEGERCDECTYGFFNFPNCTECNCNGVGSLKDNCDKKTGECECKANFAPPRCESCANGYYSFPDCFPCNCDPRGTVEGVCDKDTGSCLCKEGYHDSRCDRCFPGYKEFPDCVPCNCTDVGSVSAVCDVSGKCSCSERFSGKMCNLCSPGYYDFPKCKVCGCDRHGSVGVSCNNEGHCTCRPEFEGKLCDRCKEGLYNYPLCERCDCVPAGVTKNVVDCGSNLVKGQLCECKPRVQGRKCNECRRLFWNLQEYHPEGCIDCDCYQPGVLGGIAECDDKNGGQCHCKKSVVGRQCDQCADRSYNLQESNFFGCTDCGCDIGGAMDQVCDKITGKCRCRNRIEGRTCNVPIDSQYFPTLHQFTYELEDGFYPDDTPVRYSFDEDIFPGFSWRGYSVFMPYQNTIKQIVKVERATVYRVILRYVNRNNDPVMGTIYFKPENPGEADQNIKVVFNPTYSPQFVTASGSTDIASLFVVSENRGKWEISIEVNANLFIDYFVLVPASYYEGNILVEKVSRPCTLDDAIQKTGHCVKFQYPPILSSYKPRYANQAYISDTQEPVVEFFTNDVLDTAPMASITPSQPEIRFDIVPPTKEPFYLVVNYYTPPSHVNETAIVKLDLSDDKQTERGKLTLTPCNYMWMCRQVAIDDQGRFALFNVTAGQFTAVLTGGDNTSVAIESITAIPQSEWSVGFIAPAPKCVIIEENNCQVSKYTTSIELKKVEFENEPGAIRTLSIPDDLFEKSAGLVKSDENPQGMNITGRALAPGNKMFIVQYSQPFHPGYTIDVLVNSSLGPIKSSLKVDHCPSNIGCRALVSGPKGNNVFSMPDDFTISFLPNPNKTLWLDYVLIVPEQHFMDRWLSEEPVNNVERFRKECGQNHFYVDPANATEFCKQAIFSLTTQFNDGAQECKCNAEGTQNIRCSPFGGQCECRKNVIGRTCVDCKTGHYGFPNCRPCSCANSATCDRVTGECICPLNTEGENCEKCKPNTYDFNIYHGCKDCNCHPYGVVNRNLQCDLLLGNCSCKENIGDRTCDKCKPGYHSFPHCVKCDCDLRGTTRDICDARTSECYCKDNVEGSVCDLCREGTFNIDASHKDGCTECFCFNRTYECSSSRLYRHQIKALDNWSAVTIRVKKIVSINETSVEIDRPAEVDAIGILLTHAEFIDQIVYFSAPEPYLGNSLTSYGGYLNYSILGTTGISDLHVLAPDVILNGAGLHLLHSSDEVPAPNDLYDMSVHIIEENFQTPGGLPATRVQLMQVLEDLQAVYIRATYWEKSVTTRLEGVRLDTANSNFSEQGLALSVEECACPPQYTGLSCEECAHGYYRSSTGSYGGFCIPCQCNGHADTCDKDTGVCIDCRHDTTGDHCEKCAIGYHGDATIGRPDDCMICACPLPIKTNNFATGCEMSDDGERISCQCKPGYYGDRCESCAVGYFGSPETIGSTCKPCECSNNIDVTDPGSCDSVTGDCTKCLNHTSGPACSLCEPGFFGDAVLLKNCQGCSCAKCGTERCDPSTGLCECRANVEGEKCERCVKNHFGFDSCKGCRPCDCGLASESSQCADKDGKCMCKPGVTGRTCNVCDQGYWNYTAEGCTVCSCNIGYSVGVGCNPETGKCQCLPGVIGEKCDHCPDRWVLEKSMGCHECDKCTHDLLDTTDKLQALLKPVNEEFESVAKSYYTNRRLKFINESVDSLYPNVTRLDRLRVDLDPVAVIFQEMDDNVAYLDRENSRIGNKVNETANQVTTMNTGALKIADQAILEVQKAVMGVRDIAKNLETGTGLSTISNIEFDESLKEAKDILNSLVEGEGKSKIKDMRNEINDVHQVRAQDVYNKVKTFKDAVDKQEEALVKLRNDTDNYERKIADLKQNAKEALDLSKKLNQWTKKNKEAEIPETFRKINDLNTDSSKLLDETNEILRNMSKTLALSSNNLYENLKGQKQLWDENFNELNQTVSVLTNDDGLKGLRNLVKEAKLHASTLEDQARELAALGGKHRNDTQAVQAYAQIVNNLRDALMTAESARTTAENATELSAGLGDEASKSLDRSAELHNQAKKPLNDIKSAEIDPALTGSIEEIAKLNMSKLNLEDDLLRIENNLNTLKLSQPGDEITVKAEATERGAIEIQNDIKTIVEDIPDKMNVTKKITLDHQDAVSAVDEAQKSLAQITSNVLPNLTEIAKNLKNRPESIKETSDGLKQKIDTLKKQIELAREVANNIKVGVKFDSATSLELKNPSNLPEQAINNYVSLFFNTKDSNGMLFFLGGERQSRVKRAVTTGDFMVLELQNWLLKYTVDLGSGSKSIISDKRIERDHWYQAILERTGKSIRLTVNEDENGTVVSHVKEDVVPGDSTVLNLDKDKSKMFVGGFSMNFNPPRDVFYNAFTGDIEDLTVGDTPVGLWNFEKGENLHGATGRDKLVNTKSSTGCRFNGEGYVAINSKSYRMDRKSEVSLDFKTFAKDGLLFLSAAENNYLSIEIREGHVLFQYDLGDGLVTMISAGTYNDGKWHHVETSRLDNRGNLKVNEVDVHHGVSPGSSIKLKLPEKFYIGGYPGDHGILEVTHLDFDGCIDQVKLDSAVDLNVNREKLGVTPGCPEKFASVVSFQERGYALWPNVTSVNNAMELILRFKTRHPNGLIAYAVYGQASISLWIMDGQLVFKSGPDEIVSQSLTRYDDGEWHVVLATYDEANMKLFIDDTGAYSKPDPPKLRLLHGDLYFGGAPSHVHAEGSFTFFNGCISDATLNSAIINFGNLTETPGATIGKCSSTIRGSSPTLPPSLPTLPTKATTTTTTPLPSISPSTTMRVTTVATTAASVIREDSQNCKLPLYPKFSDQSPVMSTLGYKLGATYNSRLEYATIPGKIKNKFEFSVQIRTKSSQSVIFYVEGNLADFIALYIKDGKVHYAWDCGSGEALLTSNKAINDDKWHEIVFKRQLDKGTLIIDEYTEATGSSGTGTKTLNVDGPYYVGGVDSTVAVRASTVLKGVNETFNGCLKNFKLNNKEFGTPQVEKGVLPCSDLEGGLYFAPEGGYVKQRENFKVGDRFSIKLKVKPRVLSGLLVAIHGSHNNYLTIEMDNGIIVIKIQVNQKQTVSSYVPPIRDLLCDGEWHEISVLKTRHVVTLGVDSKFNEPTIGDRRASSLPMKNTLYIGGHPALSAAKKQYVGCLQIIEINSKPEIINMRNLIGNVTLNACPVN